MTVTRALTLDPVLLESVYRVTARHARFWGHLLARVRAARGQTPAEQATALGLTPSGLAHLALCAAPRPDRLAEDLRVVAGRGRVGVETLRSLLRDAGVADSDPGAADAGHGAAAKL
jgi:hypothetical protein